MEAVQRERQAIKGSDQVSLDRFPKEKNMKLRHEPNPKITNIDTIKRMVAFYTRNEAADYAASIGWPKSSARRIDLPFGRVRWVISDDHLNIVLKEKNELCQIP